MGYAGANAWSAAGEAAQNWARLLGQLYQGQQQQKQIQADRDIDTKRYDDAMRIGADERTAAAAHRSAMERAASEGNRREAIEGGWQPFSALGRALVGPIAGGMPGAALPAPTDAPLAKAASRSTEIGGERMAYMPQPKAPEPKFQEVRMGDGVYAVDMASGGADRRRLGDLPPQSIPPVNLQVVPTAGGLGAFDPRAGTIKPIPGEGGAQVQSPDKGPQLSPVAQNAIASNRSLIKAIDKASLALESRPESIGKKGMLPDFVLQRESFGLGDPGGVDVRAQLANIASEITLARSGGAVSDQEYERIAPFLPKDTDTPEKAKSNLAFLKQYFTDKNNTLMAPMNRNPYR